MACDAQWKQQAFIIGAYLGPNPIPVYKNGVIDSISFEEQVKLAAQAGFNFSTGNNGENGNISFQNLKYNLYAKYGIKSLYLSSLFGQRITDGKSLEAMSAYQFTGGLDSLAQVSFSGYNLIDEPPAGKSGQVLDWIKNLKDASNDKLVFVNLLPVYAFNYNIDQYQSYLQSYLDTTGTAKLDIACYDFYPFVGNNLRPLYFYNLGAVTQMAYGRPVWTYILSSAHWLYPTPDQYMLNFMIFCPLAYGVKGILYFTYQTVANSPSAEYQFGPALIDSTGEPTPLYTKATLINHFVANVIGPVIMNSTHLGTVHVSNSPWNQYLTSNDLLNSNMPLVANISNSNILTGIFQNKKNQGTFNLFVVNKANLSLSDVYIALKGNHANNITISKSNWDSEIQNGNFYQPLTAYYDPESNETWFFVNFKPGEGRMIQVDDVKNPYEKIITPSQIQFKVFPNPTDGNINMEYSLTSNMDIKIQLFDTSGRLLGTLQNKAYLTKGVYHGIANLNGLKPGLYFISLFTHSSVVSQKIVIMGK